MTHPKNFITRERKTPTVRLREKAAQMAPQAQGVTKKTPAVRSRVFFIIILTLCYLFFVIILLVYLRFSVFISPPLPQPTSQTQSVFPSIIPSPTQELNVFESYPIHTNITATVFWIGEPVGNGSSEDNALSAYDDDWQDHYGGYDNPFYRRTPQNNYFPNEFTPQENPFYLDLPFDDVNVEANYQSRTQIIPWALGLSDPGKHYSFMKNRWVRIQKDGTVCYGQIQDAGPYEYDDAAYVFGTQDTRPSNSLANNAGMDVSPALRDCLGFQDLNGDRDQVNWQFVDASQVPVGPWKIVVTTSQVYHP